MSDENGEDTPKYIPKRRGSVDDTIKDFLNPKLEFHKEELPKGSMALQIIINQCENEIHPKDDGLDGDSDVDDDKIKKPSQKYMGRRRTTIACNYSHKHEIEKHFRRMSLAPIPEKQRGRSTLLDVPRQHRHRSLSPAQENIIRRNSVHHTDVGFGSSRTRDTILK